MEACKHCNSNKHTFSKHGKFIIIEVSPNINPTTIEKLELRLRERDNFWIKKLNFYTIRLLHQELN